MYLGSWTRRWAEGQSIQPSPSVLPPLENSTGWCIWVKAGGASQPSSRQPPCSMVALMRWAREWKRLDLPRSRTSDLPPRTAGMMPASQAIRRARAAEMCSPVSSLAALRPPIRVSQGHQDHHGGVQPAGLRELVRGVAADVVGERFPQAFGGGLPLAQRSVAGAVLGGGQGEQGLLQAGTREPVEVEITAYPARRGVPDPEPVGFLGVAVLLVQELGEVGVGEVGGDDLQDRAAQVLQGLGVVVRGELDQVFLGPLLQVRVEVVGQAVDAADDRECLLVVDPRRRTAQRP